MFRPSTVVIVQVDVCSNDVSEVPEADDRPKVEDGEAEE